MSPPSDSSVRVDRASVGGALGALILFALFVGFFRPGYVQWGVDSLWVATLVLWGATIRRISGTTLLRSWPSARGLVLLGALLAIFAACWLPFYDNWRWAYTGDSVAWFSSAEGLAQHGLVLNLLSVHGVDNNFTLLHTLGFNALLFVFEPTLFWHRVGKLIASGLSLAAIYMYFATTIGRRAAVAVLIGTATNFVWLWFSYVSYGHIDSHIFYFSTLTMAALIWREPDRLGLWMLCGLVGGVALFFTQTSWSAVAAVGIVLGVFALATRRLPSAMVYGISFGLAGGPVLVQLTDLLTMTTRQAGSIYTVEYLQRIFTTILCLPFESPHLGAGVNGAFLRWPFGRLYVVGCALALIAIVPPVRRWLRIPAVAPVLLALLVWDAVLMTVTNGGYGTPSTKRTYNLIPLQVFFALLPMLVVDAWAMRWRWSRYLSGAAIGGGLGVYAVFNLLVIAQPAPGVYGVNVFDGLIELRQRFPERRVLFLTSQAAYADTFAPDSFLQRAYRVPEQLTIDMRFEDATVTGACEAHLLLCYEPNADKPRFRPLLARFDRALRPFPLLNSFEMVCYDCVTSEAASP